MIIDGLCHQDQWTASTETFVETHADDLHLDSRSWDSILALPFLSLISYVNEEYFEHKKENNFFTKHSHSQLFLSMSPEIIIFWLPYLFFTRRVFLKPETLTVKIESQTIPCCFCLFRLHKNFFFSIVKTS